MAKKDDLKNVDTMIDLHGINAEQMRTLLQQKWDEWRSLRTVRVVHGQGEILKPALEEWCRSMGIPYELDHKNPGATRIFPNRRTLSDAPLTYQLRDKGLRLTPEQEAELRDPQAAQRAKEEAARRKREEEAKRRADQAQTERQKRQDNAMFEAEMARLTHIDKQRRSNPTGDKKPHAPIVVPKIKTEGQEGYWRAELIRVGETDHDTLKTQKKTGLDKLAAPLETNPKVKQPETKKEKKAQQHRTEAEDRSLFEAEMERLLGHEQENRRR